MTGTSTMRRLVLVVGLLALLFAPRLADSDGSAPTERVVGAAVLAPTFWSDGISPGRVADDHHDLAPVATVAVVFALAAFLLVRLDRESHRVVRSPLLLTAPRWRGPPIATSPTSRDHEEMQWQRQRSGRSDRRRSAPAQRGTSRSSA